MPAASARRIVGLAAPGSSTRPASTATAVAPPAAAASSVSGPMAGDVEAEVVIAGRRLDHHRPGPAQRGAAADRLARALDRLHRADRAAPDDDGLADAGIGVESGDGEAAPDVAPLGLGGRPGRPSRGAPRPSPRKGRWSSSSIPSPSRVAMIACAMLPSSRAPRSGGHGGVGVVGLARRQQVGHPELAGEQHGRHAFTAQRRHHRAHGIDAGGDHGVGAGPEVDRAGKRERDDPPSLPARLGRHPGRQRAGTAHQPQRAHRLASTGRARPPRARRRGSSARSPAPRPASGGRPAGRSPPAPPPVGGGWHRSGAGSRA